MRLPTLDARARIAARQYRAAAQRLHAARLKALRVGREVSLTHGDQVRWVRVAEYSHGRVRVTNERTGVTYWVDGWRIRETDPDRRPDV